MVFAKTKKAGMKSKRGLSLNFIMFVVFTFVQHSFSHAAKVSNAEFPGSVTVSELKTDNKIAGAVIQIPAEQTDNEVVVVAEVMPAFPGGELAMRKFIAKAIKYPNLAAEQGIQGRVFVKFVVNKDGLVSDAKIARGVNPLLDNEAVRVIMSLPKWSPGMTQGKAVNVSLMFPISFQLQ